MVIFWIMLNKWITKRGFPLFEVQFIWDSLSLSSGAWIRTKDLRVMSPTSYHCSTPHQDMHFMT
jgi:hypothetical protein